MQITLKIKFLLAAAVVIFTLDPSSAANPSGDQRLRIVWDEVEGAVGYEIQIKNSTDSFVLKKVVDSNFIDFSLSPGGYKIRIGAMNKFRKIGSWSDWENIEIKKTITSKLFKKESSYSGSKASG